MSRGASGQDKPRWTLPPRKEISPENLHISSFVIAKKKGGSEKEWSILLLKAGDKHPLAFRRGKLLLPSTILTYGENPREGARRVIRDQLNDPGLLKDPEFSGMQSYFGAHWDIVFLFETSSESSASIVPKEPFIHAGFYDIRKLPRSEIAEDHLEVIDGFLNPSE